MTRTSHGALGIEQTREEKVKSETEFLPERAVDRRTRRHRQAAREKEISERQRDGKKPFYLTLDADGKPYGLGKPAWVAEIGKLATGLDPSCTHISRQTYEAVTTLKSRLNQSFDYSGTLNDDYLRSMMGEAVTKKRTELITLIKKGASHPLHIDSGVWERLLKLAASKQREDKSEQGRYANSCRKTFGRTGCRGVNGVRERLREKLRRSLDPDEIEFELNCDKGFAGYRQKKISAKLEKESLQVSSDENSMGSPSGSPVSRQSMSEEDQGIARLHQPTATNKVIYMEVYVYKVNAMRL